MYSKEYLSNHASELERELFEAKEAHRMAQKRKASQEELRELQEYVSIMRFNLKSFLETTRDDALLPR